MRSDGYYIDATYGRGGHANAILACLGARGRLLVIDRDPDAVAAARARHGDDARVIVEHETFGNLARVVDELGWSGIVAGILLDIGTSSPQLDTAERGFSFTHDGPLDMRMDPTRGEAASDWLARADFATIARVIRDYGEERFHKRIARAIVAAREREPLTRTRQLADLIAAAVPVREPGRHPATRAFQALRIVVNDELGQLRDALDGALDALAPAGRLCVISFHSIEDRIVKRFMRRHAQADPIWRGLPEIPPHARPRLGRPARPVRPGEAELQRNPRCRSAVLRVAEVVS